MNEWHSLLQRYVDDWGRVHYQQWQIKDRHTLSLWLTQQSLTNLSEQEPNQLLAFWLNLYNALTIAQVLEVYPIASIFPKVWGIPNVIAFYAFFQRTLWSNAGLPYSLNHIEHRLLRRQFQDPRIHFALVCASVGCPLLRREAYTPELVQQQLSQDAHRFINNRAKVRYEPEQNCLYLSPIFRWYLQDFQKVAASLAEYVGSYLDYPLPLLPSPSIRYLAYDWSLNQRISP